MLSRFAEHFTVVQHFTHYRTGERLVILKDRRNLNDYAEVLDGRRISNILEFGIYHSGSPALFTLWLEADKFVGIDISDPVVELDSFCSRLRLGAKIRSHYGTSQTDAMRVSEIIVTEFGSVPIDLIIDGASHNYSDETHLPTPSSLDH